MLCNGSFCLGDGLKIRRVDVDGGFVTEEETSDLSGVLLETSLEVVFVCWTFVLV